MNRPGICYYIGKNLAGTFIKSDHEEFQDVIRGFLSGINAEWLPYVGQSAVSKARDAGYKHGIDYQIEDENATN